MTYFISHVFCGAGGRVVFVASVVFVDREAFVPNFDVREDANRLAMTDPSAEVSRVVHNAVNVRRPATSGATAGAAG